MCGSDPDLEIYLNAAPDPDFSIAMEGKIHLHLLSFFSQFENVDVGTRHIFEKLCIRIRVNLIFTKIIRIVSPGYKQFRESMKFWCGSACADP